MVINSTNINKIDTHLST